MKSSQYLVSVFVVALFLACGTTLFAQQESTPLPNYVRNPEYKLTGFGVYGGVEFGLHSAKFANFAPALACCNTNFPATIGRGWSAGITFDHSLTNWLMLDVRAGINVGEAEFSTIESLFALTQIGFTRMIDIRHSLNVQFTNISFDPALKLRILPLPTTTTYAPSLYLLGGLGVRYFTQNIFSYEEAIYSPDSSRIVNFLIQETDANGRIVTRTSSRRNVITNQDIPSFNQLQFMPFVGLESDIFLESQYPANWLIAPYLRFYFATTDMANNLVSRERGTTQTSVGSWRMNAVQLGISVKYRDFTLQK